MDDNAGDLNPSYTEDITMDFNHATRGGTPTRRPRHAETERSHAMDDYFVQMKSLDEQQRLLFQNEFITRRKDVSTGVILCLFLGGLGLHRVYMGQPGIGAVYAIFCWTFVPTLIGLVECFLMPSRIRKYNVSLAHEVAAKLKAL